MKIIKQNYAGQSPKLQKAVYASQLVASYRSARACISAHALVRPWLGLTLTAADSMVCSFRCSGVYACLRLRRLQKRTPEHVPHTRHFVDPSSPSAGCRRCRTRGRASAASRPPTRRTSASGRPVFSVPRRRRTTTAD